VRKKNLGRVLDLLHSVDTIQRNSEELGRALRRRDFRAALALTLSPSDLGVDASHLKGVSETVSGLRDMYTAVQAAMDQALLEQTDRFESDVYENIVGAYAELNKLAVIPQRLQGASLAKAGAQMDAALQNQAARKSVAKFRRVLTRLIEGAFEVLQMQQQIVK